MTQARWTTIYLSAAALLLAVLAFLVWATPRGEDGSAGTGSNEYAWTSNVDSVSESNCSRWTLGTGSGCTGATNWAPNRRRWRPRSTLSARISEDARETGRAPMSGIRSRAGRGGR